MGEPRTQDHKKALQGELLHFAAKPVTHVTPVVKQEAGPKPQGLWVSVGMAWPEWCAAEDFAQDRFAYMTRVVLAEDANVLRIARARELDAFTHRYAIDEQGLFGTYSLDWARVAEAHDGIIIAPHIWSRRLSIPLTRWYYGWDCASGCLWHPRAVAELDSIVMPTAAEVHASVAV